MVTAYGLVRLVRLNPVASLIWLLSDGCHSEESILKILKRRFPGIAIESLREDVASFLSQAESWGVMVRQWDPLQPYRVTCERLTS